MLLVTCLTEQFEKLSVVVTVVVLKNFKLKKRIFNHMFESQVKVFENKLQTSRNSY